RSYDLRGSCLHSPSYRYLESKMMKHGERKQIMKGVSIFIKGSSVMGDEDLCEVKSYTCKRVHQSYRLPIDSSFGSLNDMKQISRRLFFIAANSECSFSYMRSNLRSKISDHRI